MSKFLISKDTWSNYVNSVDSNNRFQTFNAFNETIQGNITKVGSFRSIPVDETFSYYNTHFSSAGFNSQFNQRSIGEKSGDTNIQTNDTTTNIPGSDLDVHNAGLPDIEGKSSFTEVVQSEGSTEEGALDLGSAASALTMAVPMINSNIMSMVDQNQLELERKGLGEQGVAVGHDITDQQNFSNKQIAATVGSGLMFAGLATGDPLLGAAGIATGAIAETVMPMAMQNDNMVQSTSGNLVSPQ
jgi:hypothetical protein